MMTTQDVLFQCEGAVATIRLNRPNKLNALSFDMHKQINVFLAEAERDKTIRVLVVTGTGRGFCAGDDLKESDPRAGHAPDEYTSIDWHLFVRKLRALPMPTIAAVNGICCGAGIGLALGCDLRIASELARFGDIFIRRGIVGGAALLTKLLGTTRALELIYTGDFIGAHEGHRIGLYNKVVAPEALEETTMALAKRLADGPPWALAESKAAVYRIETLVMDEALRVEEAAKLESLKRPDYKEAVMAFNDKRKPRFQAS
jgi:2-(1,2-epoxy-1,2-dihydrophenyl)acetyl-CoA isomerase